MYSSNASRLEDDSREARGNVSEQLLQNQSGLMGCASPEEPRSWYCVRTQPKHEHIAAANLQRQLELEVFHPRLRIERPSRRGVMRVIEPLFPGYVFTRCTLQEHLTQIRYINGVSSLVHFGNHIPVVPEATIIELRECFETEEPMSVQDRLFPGAEVSVAEGAFLGFRGIVVRLLPARQRVQILLDFLGRTTVAEVNRTSLIVENSTVADMLPSLANAPLDRGANQCLVAG